MSGRSRRVLNVGHCQMDHGAISLLIESRFDAEVEACASIPQALRRLAEHHFDLVLVNRVLDGSHDQGVELVSLMCSTPSLGRVPAMLVSNLDSAQFEAVQAGAIRGFGKSDLDEPRTLQALAPYLS